MDKINAQGGIDIGGTKELVELTFEDDESDKLKAKAIVDKLVTEVDFIMAPYSSGSVISVLPATDRAKAGMVIWGGASDEIYSSGYNNIVGLSTVASQYMHTGLEALAAVGARSVSFLYEDKVFATTVCNGAKDKAVALGMTVAGDHQYLAGDLDFVGLVGLVKEANPDVLVGCGHADDAVLLTSTAKTYGLIPRAILSTQTGDSAYVTKVGVINANGILGPTQWMPTLPLEDPFFGSAGNFSAAYAARANGEIPTYHAAAAAASLYSLGLAIEKAGVKTTNEVFTELKKLDEPSFYGQLKFGSNGAIVGKPMMTTQVGINGTLSVVAPKELQDRTMVYPRPPWPVVTGTEGLPLVELSQLAEKWLRDAQKKVETAYNDIKGEGVSDCSVVEACGANGNGASLQQHTGWPMKVDFTTAVTGFPDAKSTTDEVKQAKCLASSGGQLVEMWKEQYQSINSPTGYAGFQQFGDQSTGALTQFPATDSCSKQDARFTPWYSTAAAGPKDVIVVVDQSGSMGQGTGRWEAAQEAVGRVLDSMTEYDYGAVVLFSDRVSVAAGETTMISMNTTNIQRIKTWLAGEVAGGFTNYELGLQKAFTLVDENRRKKRTAGCSTLILFMSDGQISRGASDIALYKKIRTWNHGDLNAIIFTYSFGDSVKPTTLKRIACQNHGMWYEVPDGGDLAAVMASYFVYFASTSKVERLKWTKASLSVSKKTLTGCLPAYDRNKAFPRMFGVTCVDLTMFAPMEDIQLKPDLDVFEKKRERDSKQCAVPQPDVGQLQLLRGEVSGNAGVCSGLDLDLTMSDAVVEAGGTTTTTTTPGASGAVPVGTSVVAMTIAVGGSWAW